MDGLLWHDLLSSEAGNATEILNYRTYLNGDEVYVGYLVLPTNPDELPSFLFAGTIYAKKGGTTNVVVEFWIGDAMDSASTEVQAFQKWIASIPLMIILLLGLFRHVHVIYALTVGLLLGSGIVTGKFIEGFKSAVTRYTLTAASNPHHVYM